MLRLLSVLGSVPYEHPTLATAPQFLSGLPASTLIPKKEPAGSRRVNVKRLPTWHLEPGLETFGPYVKKAGIAYTLQDLSILARALPDVSLPVPRLVSSVSIILPLDPEPDLWAMLVLPYLGQRWRVRRQPSVWREVFAMQRP